MASEQQTISEYIDHHLTNLCVGSCDPITHKSTGFWSINLDTMIFSILIGGFFVMFLLFMARKAHSGKPNKMLCFVEMLIEFVESAVQGICGKKRRDVTAIALTFFCFIILCNLMDLVPVGIFPSLGQIVGLNNFKIVPTADVSITMALALTSVGIGYYKGIKKNGFHFFTAMFTHPFGKMLFPINFVFRIIEDLAKILSLGLRLFGNMFAGELIFILIASLPFFIQLAPGGIWAVFHILVVPLQAYLFMMLTVVYINMFEEH